MGDEKIKDGTFKIRPAGRHIITIGRDLIKDKYAAIVELVKNAYDADSPTCKISLLPFKSGDIRKIKVVIKDQGHGMDYETVVEKWMVPSTDDKFHRGSSPSGRVMQGKKGIGRYSASMIGDDLYLQTIHDNELTNLYLVWEEFEKAKYLEDVDILIEHFKTDKINGTELTMIGDERHVDEWDIKQIQNLKFELKKLIPPVDQQTHTVNSDSNFKIELELGNFPFEHFSNTNEIIEPYPLFELFDYRISGIVTADGTAKLKFENNRSESEIEDLKVFKIKLNTNASRKAEQAYCGDVQIDFRVFDRDPISIDGLIRRGLKDPITGNYVGKNEARAILDTFNGVGVFRNGFRIRPMGDAGYDWLELDRERVQNPSLHIGSDQIIGFIHIESENLSGLQEKSARDGLRETAEYFGLQEISKQVLQKLEERRFSFRKSVGLGRNKNSDISKQINNLSDFNKLKSAVKQVLVKLGASEAQKEEIEKVISEKENENNKIAGDLQESIALYQGQATLGKIVNVILHEGRKPLSYFRNQIPRISEWIEEVNTEYDQETLLKISSRLTTLNEQTGIFINLFDKLDPLQSKKRNPKKDFNLFKVIEDVYDVFHSQINSQSIDFVIECEKDQMSFGWKDDFYIAFTNLVDNSLYWLSQKDVDSKEIKFKVFEEGENLNIEYSDNGPGIDKHLIETQIIFDPEFTSKKGGTGLGLAISGEAIYRNNGTLKAVYSNSGALFIIEIPK